MKKPGNRVKTGNLPVKPGWRSVMLKVVGKQRENRYANRNENKWLNLGVEEGWKFQLRPRKSFRGKFQYIWHWCSFKELSRGVSSNLVVGRGLGRRLKKFLDHALQTLSNAGKRPCWTLSNIFGQILRIIVVKNGGLDFHSPYGYTTGAELQFTVSTWRRTSLAYGLDGVVWKCLGLKWSEMEKDGLWGVVPENFWVHAPFRAKERIILEITPFKILYPVLLNSENRFWNSHYWQVLAGSKK